MCPASFRQPILNPLWRHHADLLPRPDAGRPAYAWRIKGVDLRGLPEPARQPVRALVGLVSASAMADATGVAWDELIGPPGRSWRSANRG